MSDTNRLIHESSPYLRQHARNPVNWYPWGDEAFEKADSEDKVMIISIGYSSCHWCHVMEEETFENTEAAGLMNEHFVCVKVDREERPDIDAHYMNSLQLISGQGGWPLNIFALPDGRAFYGGTYFPTGNWMEILKQVDREFRQNRTRLEKTAASVEQGIRRYRSVLLENEISPFAIKDLESALAKTKEGFDLRHGGIGKAPKFPMPVFYDFLLSWSALQNDQEIRDFVLLTLDRMAAGGMYDRIGGGFARYSVDGQWKVPHFEKMLYDNAQLISLYAQAFKATGKEEYKTIAEESLNFIEESMTSPEGLYYSALDADSEGEEGLYYVWKETELKSLLGEDYSLAEKRFGIGGPALWEGKNILLEAETTALTPEEAEGMKRIRNILKEARDKRIPPGLDHKSLTSWNALMISAYIQACDAFGNKVYLAKAAKGADAILEHLRDKNGRLYHVFAEGKHYNPGFLEDYAHFIAALISLYESGGKHRYLKEARELCASALELFYNAEEEIFYNSEEGDRAVQRDSEISDITLPSGNAVMAHNLFRLSKLCGASRYGELSNTLVLRMSSRVLENPTYFSHWAKLMLFMSRPYYETVVVGSEAERICRELKKVYMPAAVFAFSNEQNDGIPLFKGRYIPEKTLIYICRDNSCGLPVETIEQVLDKWNHSGGID